MAGFNKVILMGNLTRNPELRYTPSGTPVASFGLAVSRRFKQGEELKEEVCFVDIVVFGKQAGTHASKYVKSASEPDGQYVGVQKGSGPDQMHGLLPLVPLAAGDPEVVVDIGEIGPERDRLAQGLDGRLHLALAQAAQAAAVMEIEGLGTAQERRPHARLGILEIAALEARGPRGIRLVDGADRQFAHGGELARR